VGDGAATPAQLSALLELTSDFVASATLDGSLTYLNRGGRAMLGWPLDGSLEGRAIADCHPEAAARRVFEVGIPAALERGVWRGESMLRSVDGEPIPVSQVIVARRGADGVFLATIMRDIRDRKKIEEELRASTEMLQLVMDYIPQFVFWKDRDSVYRGCNRNFARVAGVASPSDIIGKTDFDLAWKREEAEFFRKVDRQVMESDAPELHIIEPQLQADGKQAWLDTNKIPLRDDDGRVVGILGTFEDITARKLAEDALIEREQNMRALLDSIGDAVIATDPEGRVTRMNPVAESVTGWAAEDALGASLRDVFWVTAGPDGPVIDDPFGPLLERGALTGPGELLSLRAKDGQTRQISERGSEIRNAEGALQGLVLVFRDVTEQRAIEQQLRHSQRMDSLGRLAGGVAHDFNNMLGAIVGSADLLTRRLDGHDPVLQTLARNILQAADRAGTLTRKLLSFSRKGLPAREAFDLNEIVESSCSLLRRTIDRRVVLKQRASAEEAICVGDPTQIQNAIINLGLNARDAMPEGGTLLVATSNVTLSEEDCARSAFDLDPGRYVALEVSDDGVGMSEDVAQRAFEPFFTTKAVGAGTGLGLSAVYAAVTEHRGAIHLFSRPENGTTFRVFLPVAGHAEVRAASDEILARGRGMILVVDDEPMMRETAAAMLQSLGYDALTADGGPAALALYARDPSAIDLVLLDLVMPEMSGREVVRELLSTDPDARVVLTSGFSHESHLGDDEGPRGFIEKPYRLGALAAVVAAALAGER